MQAFGLRFPSKEDGVQSPAFYTRPRSKKGTLLGLKGLEGNLKPKKGE